MKSVNAILTSGFISGFIIGSFTFASVASAATAPKGVGYSPSAPKGVGYSPSTLVLIQNQPMTPALMSNSGGAPTAVYVSPNLPAGLSINQNTGTISGTPTQVSPMILLSFKFSPRSK
jgi:hypothetical protein